MKLTIILAAAAVGAAVLTGCGHDDERYAEVACVDRTTQVRVDDWRCNNNDPNFLPWYLTAGQPMFGYGQRAPYGSVAPPQGYRTRTITATPPPASTSRAGTTTAPSTSAPKATTAAPKTTAAPQKTQSQKPQTKAPAAPKPKPATKPK